VYKLNLQVGSTTAHHSRHKLCCPNPNLPEHDMTKDACMRLQWEFRMCACTSLPALARHKCAAYQDRTKGCDRIVARQPKLITTPRRDPWRHACVHETWYPLARKVLVGAHYRRTTRADQSAQREGAREIALAGSPQGCPKTCARQQPDMLTALKDGWLELSLDSTAPNAYRREGWMSETMWERDVEKDRVRCALHGICDSKKIWYVNDAEAMRPVQHAKKPLPVVLNGKSKVKTPTPNAQNKTLSVEIAFRPLKLRRFFVCK